VLFGLISFCLSEWVFSVLISAEYSEYSKYLPFFVAAGIFAVCAGILQLVVFGLYDTRGASVLIALSISLGLLLISFLIYICGFLGAVVGLSLASMVSMLVFAMAINKRLFAFA
jgi:O-antigen/teichoic acid export membrane protein